MVLVGEIALERLGALLASRTEKSKNPYKYEITNYITNFFKDEKDIKYGDINLITKIFRINKNDNLGNYLKIINPEEKDSISHQFINIYLNSTKKNNDNINIINYIKNLNLSNKNKTIFQKFLLSWKLLNQVYIVLKNDIS